MCLSVVCFGMVCLKTMTGFNAYPVQEQYSFSNTVQNCKPSCEVAVKSKNHIKNRTTKTVERMKRKRESIDDDEEREGEPRSKKRTDSLLGGKFESRFASFDNDFPDGVDDESKKGKGKKHLNQKRKSEAVKVDCMSQSGSLCVKASKRDEKNKPRNNRRSSVPSSVAKLEKAKQRLKLKTIGANRSTTLAKFGMEIPEITRSDRPNKLINELRKCLKKMDPVELTIKRKITHLYR